MKNGSLLFVLDKQNKNSKVVIIFEDIKNMLYVYIPYDNGTKILKYQDFINNYNQNDYDFKIRNPIHHISKKLQYLCNSLVGYKYHDIFHLGEDAFNKLIDKHYKEFIKDNFAAIHISYILKKIHVIDNDIKYYIHTLKDLLNCDITGFLYGIYGNIEMVGIKSYQCLMNTKNINFSFPSIELFLQNNEDDELKEIIKSIQK